MLGKLLKYDLRWCFKPLILFYILAIFFSVIIRVVESMEQSLIIVIIDKICVGTLIAMFINILINCFMRNWARFVKNVYKDESYLTHTLPVSKNTIYCSKILSISITLLTSIFVIIASLAIGVLTENNWLFFKDYLEQSAIYFNSSVFSIVTFVIITIFFELLFVVMTGVLGIIIGNRSNNYKMLKSIAYGFGIYLILSCISLGVLYGIGCINSDIMAVFNNIDVSSETIKGVMIITIIVYAIYIIAEYFVGRKLLNKGVDVD